MALQLSEIQELYELATKKATTLYKMYLLVSRNITRKQPLGIFTGPNSFKSTETFALREFETFQPNEVIYRAHAVPKITCRKDAGLSAAR